MPDYPVGCATDIEWPGLTGYVWNCGERGLNVSWIEARPRFQGNCGRFITALQERYPVIRFPAVISVVLQGMLERRGFKVEWERSDDFGEDVDLMVWRKEGAS